MQGSGGVKVWVRARGGLGLRLGLGLGLGLELELGLGLEFGLEFELGLEGDLFPPHMHATKSFQACGSIRVGGT